MRGWFQIFQDDSAWAPDRIHPPVAIRVASYTPWRPGHVQERLGRIWSIEVPCSSLSLHFTTRIRAELQDDFPLRGQAGHGALLKEPNLRFIWEAIVLSVCTQANKITKTMYGHGISTDTIKQTPQLRTHHPIHTNWVLSAQSPEFMVGWKLSYRMWELPP